MPKKAGQGLGMSQPQGARFPQARFIRLMRNLASNLPWFRANSSTGFRKVWKAGEGGAIAAKKIELSNVAVRALPAQI
jgi:hypothetical protein